MQLSLLSLSFLPENLFKGLLLTSLNHFYLKKNGGNFVNSITAIINMWFDVNIF